MNARERTAHGVVVSCLDLLVSGDAIWLEVAPALDSSLRRFRPRCPVSSCRHVLTLGHWYQGLRTNYCKGCGWQTNEASLWP